MFCAFGGFQSIVFGEDDPPTSNQFADLCFVLSVRLHGGRKCRRCRRCQTNPRAESHLLGRATSTPLGAWKPPLLRFGEAHVVFQLQPPVFLAKALTIILRVGCRLQIRLCSYNCRRSWMLNPADLETINLRYLLSRHCPLLENPFSGVETA